MKKHQNEIVLGNFHSILTESETWKIGGFPLPDGSFHEFREPEAVVIVRNDELYVRVNPFTKSHPSVQFLDNAKHMYYSNDPIKVPQDGTVSFQWKMRSRPIGTNANDLYDGFVSVNLLDFTTGAALDFFAGNDQYASVYAVLPFPGVSVPETDKTRYFCIFKEEQEFNQREWNEFEITYNRSADEVKFLVNGNIVRTEKDVPIKFNEFTVALGLMTEKDLSPKGSTSLHGQGIIGEWSPMKVSFSE
ncbi:DUF6081 family protein [Fictibacillus phosphorivorans]|uniref:DUF6081 family protein n=1 Tax=Fictibacillus phosphorivorans TaxID=1221500 RepID=UPI0012937C88|nr:DUF6081 family protein [Fictibacillus phosphorivorans]MQR96340.1 hypothetical protein [Fictibacillus phosphorivorans]